MEIKRHIRKEALTKRNHISIEDRNALSKHIYKKLVSKNLFQQADIILTYVSYGSEVETDLLIYMAILQGKQVYAPRVFTDSKMPIMDFYGIQTIEEMEIGYKGIREPYPWPDRKFSYEQEIKEKHKKVLMIMPGVAFSKERVRIGYGKGFYDAYLFDKPEIQTIALSYQCQIYEQLDEERHDIKPQLILTECEEFI